jgi:hypothetical protein
MRALEQDLGPGDERGAVSSAPFAGLDREGKERGNGLPPEGSIFATPDSSSNALAMTARLSPVAAVSHRAPTAILQPALVDKQPPAAAIVLTLPYLVRPCPSHQFRG